MEFKLGSHGTWDDSSAGKLRAKLSKTRGPCVAARA